MNGPPYVRVIRVEDMIEFRLAAARDAREAAEQAPDLSNAVLLLEHAKRMAGFALDLLLLWVPS